MKMSPTLAQQRTNPPARQRQLQANLSSRSSKPCLLTDDLEFWRPKAAYVKILPMSEIQGYRPIKCDCRYDLQLSYSLTQIIKPIAHTVTRSQLARSPKCVPMKLQQSSQGHFVIICHLPMFPVIFHGQHSNAIKY